MKKSLIIFFLIFFLLTTYFKTSNDSISVMSINEYEDNHYELIFEDELLNLRNFKLKIAPITSYEYNITKVYIKYSDNIKKYFSDKEYFSFDNSNINIGLEKLKEEYTNILRNNYLYDELDKDINDVVISKIEVYMSEDALKKLRLKYPKVIIRKISIKK